MLREWIFDLKPQQQVLLTSPPLLNLQLPAAGKSLQSNSGIALSPLHWDNQVKQQVLPCICPGERNWSLSGFWEPGWGDSPGSECLCTQLQLPPSCLPSGHAASHGELLAEGELKAFVIPWPSPSPGCLPKELQLRVCLEGGAALSWHGSSPREELGDSWD